MRSCEQAVETAFSYTTVSLWTFLCHSLNTMSRIRAAMHASGAHVKLMRICASRQRPGLWTCRTTCSRGATMLTVPYSVVALPAGTIPPCTAGST